MTKGQMFALVFLMGTGLLVGLMAIIARTDIGQAIADAIRHNSGANEGAAVRRELAMMKGQLDQVQVELDDVHTQLLEAHERLEFAERLLAKAPEPQHLPGTP